MPQEGPDSAPEPTTVALPAQEQRPVLPSQALGTSPSKASGTSHTHTSGDITNTGPGLQTHSLQVQLQCQLSPPPRWVSVSPPAWHTNTPSTPSRMAPPLPHPPDSKFPAGNDRAWFILTAWTHQVLDKPGNTAKHQQAMERLGGGQRGAHFRLVLISTLTTGCLPLRSSQC